MDFRRDRNTFKVSSRMHRILIRPLIQELPHPNPGGDNLPLHEPAVRADNVFEHLRKQAHIESIDTDNRPARGDQHDDRAGQQRAGRLQQSDRAARGRL